MLKSRIMLLPFLTALSLTMQPVVAHEVDKGWHGRGAPYTLDGGGNRLEITKRLADRLGLTQEQRKALDGIADKFRSDSNDLRQLMSDNHRALAEMQAGDPKLHELAEAQGKTIADLIILNKQIRSEVDKVLTDAQREKLSRFEHHPRRHR